MRPSRASNHAPSVIPTPPAIVWESPSFDLVVDSDGAWDLKDNCIDENKVTLSYSNTSNHWIECEKLNLTPEIANRVRLWKSRITNFDASHVDIEAYDLDAEDYVRIATNAAIGIGVWNVFEFPRDILTLTIRIRYLDAYPYPGPLNEVQLGYQE